MKYASPSFNRAVALLSLAMLTMACCAAAQSNLFFDDFNGPTMNQGWGTSGFATTSNPTSYPFAVSYVGSPDVAFQTIGGASTLRMSTEQPPLHRVGWTLNTVFTNSSYRFEVRFNTLIQSATTSIDGCIEIWVVDASNSNRCDVAGLFGSSYSTSPRFLSGSTIDQISYGPNYTYRNNTWYRVVLQGSTNENIQASLCDDQGNELISQVLAHDLRAFPAGFKIGISQGMGTPNGVYPMDIAVDYAVLSTFSGSGPVLTESPVPGGFALEWPVSLHFILESTPSLSVATQWTPVTNQVTVLNGVNSVFVTNNDTSTFCRLRYQSP